MSDEWTDGYSVLFRITRSSDIYSIPVQYVTRVESSERQTAPAPHTPEHIIGVCQLQGKNISMVDLGCLLGLEHTPNDKHSRQSLLIIVNAKIGFLVESVLGVEALHSRQSSGPLSKQLIQNVYLCDEWNDFILELDVPCLLSIC